MKSRDIVLDRCLAERCPDIRHGSSGSLVFVSKIHLYPQFVMSQGEELNLVVSRLISSIRLCSSYNSCLRSHRHRNKQTANKSSKHLHLFSPIWSSIPA